MFWVTGMGLFIFFFPKYFYKVLDAFFFLSLFLSLRLVPSMPPVDFKAYNLTSEAFINVSCSPADIDVVVVVVFYAALI